MMSVYRFWHFSPQETLKKFQRTPFYHLYFLRYVWIAMTETSDLELWNHTAVMTPIITQLGFRDFCILDIGFLFVPHKTDEISSDNRGKRILIQKVGRLCSIVLEMVTLAFSTWKILLRTKNHFFVACYCWSTLGWNFLKFAEYVVQNAAQWLSCCTHV